MLIASFYVDLCKSTKEKNDAVTYDDKDLKNSKHKLTEVNSFKKKLLIAHEMSPSTQQNSEIIRFHGNVFLLIVHIKNKDKLIDSILCQLFKRDDELLQSRCPIMKRKTIAV